MKLPSANTNPLDEAAREARVGASRIEFLDSLVGEEPVFGLLKTRTRTDTGNWFFKRPVWACTLAGELLLFAKGKRPYAERVPFDKLGASTYNHVTGELMLAPADGLRVTRLKMPPMEGLQVLAHVHRGE